MSTKTPQGYHSLALLMGRYTEASIFRRFGSLVALNIMSLQAELVELQDEFYDICGGDELSGKDPHNRYSRHFRTLRESLNSDNPARYEKLLAIREKLHEYSMSYHVFCKKFE